MKKVIKYRIVWIEDGKPYRAWSEDKNAFIPAEMKLYTTSYNTLDEVFSAMRQIKRETTGLFTPGFEKCFIDSYIAYIE